ncbi:MAG: site-2 protease family protein [Candidatus Thermoplasmatota archaeon]
MDGWLVFLFLLVAYVGLVTYVRRRNKPLRGGFELNGPFLMWRTQFGKRWLEKVARPRAFWNVIADGGIILTWVMGALIFVFLAFLFVLQVQAFFAEPSRAAANAESPQFLIGIPGVNPLIPVGYGIVAIILALVIHEGSHGVIAYASRMKVKSLGLLMFIVPVGAFVEPDEEDLERSTTREKNRVFAAGPTSNIVLAVVAGILLSTVFLGVLTPVQDHGVLATTIQGESGASVAGLQPLDRIITVEGTSVNSRGDFSRALNGTAAGQQVGVDYERDGKTLHAEAILTNKGDYYRKLGITNETLLKDAEGKGFLGMSVVGAGDLDLVREDLAHPLSSFRAFLFYNLYPLYVFSQGGDVLAAPYHDFFMVHGPLAFLPVPVFFAIAAVLYWIVWINITLATFNALPMGPLDGGQMFRVTLRDRLMKRYRVDPHQVHVERADMGGMKLSGRDPETQVKLDKIQGIVKRTTYTLGFGILGLILIPILVPHVLRLFYG